ncbi:ricin-type beta-trefoil lectin domain protein [Streptomyces sp. NPDC048179]|uniref:ricin-type beta-trefoil lectin domain protein n=1 Tax=Streptomyces sp. NPDC048179 TaxID=3365506 RepID=UPI00371CDCA3
MRRTRLGAGAVLAGALLVGLLPTQAAALPSPGGNRSGVDLIDLPTEDTAADADTGVLDDLAGEATVPPVEYEPAHTTAPSGGTANVSLSDPTAGNLQQAGSLPVLLGAPADATPEEASALDGTWQVEVADPAQTSTAEVDGTLLTVTPPASAATASVDVALDYSDFEQLYSADWADRMQFVTYPECFLTTPLDEACNQATPLATDNDDDTGQIRATVDVAAATTASATADQASLSGDDSSTSESAVYHPDASKSGALKALLPQTGTSGSGSVVLAATDSGSGAKGDYTATPLAASGTWSAGGSSGAFTWSQPVTVPPVPAGPAPDVAFGYNSQVVDGRTSATNNQASWIGDGWDYQPGSIERTYRTCRDDTDGDANNASHKTSDLCWGSYNAVLSLGGSTTELVVNASTCPDGNLDAPSCDWVTANGDGSRVERIKDTGKDNGDKDGEYWRVTTRDGTQYYFGLNKLPGWSSDDDTTDSVLTVPVAGNQSGEPCHDSDFASSFCAQAWRWNLDYVVDVHGNAMSLWWDKESNYYGQNEKYTKPVSYNRGGSLKRIDYGQRSNTLFTADPIARVSFTVDERCFDEAETGLTCTDDAFTSQDYGRYRLWYDTPANLYCSGAAGKRCSVGAPTFWSRKRLSSVTTYAQRTQGSTTLSKVDKYLLTQTFPRTLTDTAPPLWLESIQRTGYAVDGTAQKLNAVEFSHNNQAMPNRVITGASDPRPAFDRLRIRRVVTEYGGEIDVDYSDPCPAMATSAHPKPEENGTRCYPVYWSPDPDQETIDWFNKYVVTSITQKPRVDGVPDLVTEYQYPTDGAAWAKNQTEFSKKTTRTYDQWRGYEQVTVLTGKNDSATGIVRGKTVTRYFRGMDGDPLPGGGTRSVTVKDSTGADIATDKPAFQGMTAESLTYTQANDDGTGGSVASRTVSSPSAHLLATRPRTDVPDLKAYRTQIDQSIKVTPATGTNPDDNRTSRTVKTTTLYDDTYGLPYQVETVADTGRTGDRTTTCAQTSYLHNTSAWLIGLTEQTKTTAGTCSQAATATGDDVITASRTAYDSQSYGTAPTKGEATSVWSPDGLGTGWIRTSKTTYDDYGRVKTVEDAAGHIGTTGYNPSSGQVFSTTATNNTLGFTSTTTVEPGRGSPVTSEDTNKHVVTQAYDALGRTTAVWTASQNPATDDPSKTFAYDITVGKPAAVTTSTLRDDGTYADTVTLYDGLGRPRQSQTDAVGGGRIVTDTLYNAAGTVRRTNNGYYAAGAPSTTPFELKSDFEVPSATVTTYDGQSRPVTVTPYEAGTPKTLKRTTYAYDKDVTTVVPPVGSPATRTFTDVLQRTVRIDQFTDALHASHTSTTYGYDPRGDRVSATDTEGNAWTWTYDARGRQTQAVDPDTGTTTTTYDDLDHKLTTTDDRGITVWTGYDALGRTTEQRLDDDQGDLLTKFTYDTIPGAKGQPVSATRYNDGVPITTTVTGYDAEYRPTGKNITIPFSLTTTATTGLDATYSYSYAYTKTGLQQSVTTPAVGGLSQEKVITRYNADGLPTSTSGLDWYTAETSYSPYGEVLRTVTGEMPNRVWTTNLFDENTGQLDRTVTDRETADSHRVNDRYYTYDNAGNVTQLKDTDGAGSTDRQCFTYDALGQLHEAWTSLNEGCAASGQTTAAPVYTDSTGKVTATNVTSANDGYWQTYTYDTLGNRKRLTEHDPNVTVTDGQVKDTGDTTTDYAYGNDTGGQPHTLTGITTDTTTIDTAATLSYDKTGNTETRTYGGDTQALDWTWDGKVKTVSGFGKAGSGQLIGLDGKCLDLQSANTADKTPLQIYTCNGTKAQNFRLDTQTGALTVLGKCAMPTGGATTDGTPVTLASCTGNADQKWTVTNGTLKHAASGKCLDIPGGDSTDGTDLQITTCNGNAAQKWAFSDQTSYLYDAAGNRIIAATTSAHTLYLPDTELSTDAGGDVAYCQRYYGQAGAPTVMRHTDGGTSSTLTALAADQQGTAVAAIALTTGQAVQRQKTDPFGVPRGTADGRWQSHRGYLGGTDDTTTGLTHLGAREYDPDTGHFISADPVLDIADPLQMNGYAYAGNSPVTKSDPTGLFTPISNTGGTAPSPSDGMCPSLRNANCPEYDGSDGGVDVGGNGNTSSTGQGSGSGHKGSGGLLGWLGDVGKTIYHETKNTGIALVTTPIQQIVTDKRCITSGDDCMAMLTQLVYSSNPAAAAAAAATSRGAEIAGDYAHGRSAEGTGKLIFDLAMLIGTRGAGAEVEGEVAATRVKLPRGCSFTPSTPVLMANGKAKPIGDIKTGDKVEAADPETGKHQGPRKVAATLINHDYDLIDLRIRRTDGTTETLHTNAKHPFWDATLDTWVPAGQLRPGHALSTALGYHVYVADITRLPGDRDMYNLTVDDLHTYYVVAGGTPILVHNTGKACRVFSVDSSGTATSLPVHEIDSSTYPGVADNFNNALANGESPIVTRLTGRAAIRANRNAAQAGQPRPGTLMGGMSWEEFPFASTVEGGSGATLRLIPRNENVSHGRDSLWPFLRDNGINSGDQYYVRTQ